MSPFEQPTEVAYQPPLAEKLKALRSILGEEQKPLIEEPAPGKSLEEARRGYEEISEEKLIDDMAELLKSDGPNTFRKLVRYRTDLHLLTALRSWKKLAETTEPRERERLTREYLIANQEASYYQYLGEAVAIIERVLDRVGELRRRCAELRVPVPKEFDDQERLARQFIDALQGAMTARVRIGNALTMRWMLQQKEDSERPRTPKNPQEAVQIQTDRAIAARAGIAGRKREDLEKRYQEALESLPTEEVALLNGADHTAVAKHLNALEHALLSVMTGKKEQTGLPADFNASTMYRRLWNALNEELWHTQAAVEKERGIAKNPAAKPSDVAGGNLEQYIRSSRADLQRHLANTTWENGGFQFILMEIADVQNQFGKRLTTAEAGDPSPTSAPSEADALDGWLEQRGKLAEGHIRLSLEAAEKMLAVTLPERKEDWSKHGDIVVEEIADRLGRIATFWIPSEKDESALARAYRASAGATGMPRSREEKMRELAGPIKEAIGIPPGKRWKDLTGAEKQVVIERCHSIVDAKKGFDRERIANVRRSLDLLDRMPHATSPEIRGQEADPVLIRRIEALLNESKIPGMGQRVDKDMSGMTVEGTVINRATAFQLLLRQSQRDWGNPEKGTGFMGEYLKYLQSLEGNVQRHLDVAGAMFEMQKAWEQYALNIAKAAAAAAATGALAPWIIAMLAAAGGAAGRLVLSGGRLLLRGGLRGTKAVASLAEAGPVRAETTNALLKMRYLARERQLTQALEKTRVGRFIGRLDAVRNMQAVRYGGNLLKAAGWAAVPAATAYEMYLTQQRVETVQGNPALKKDYAEGHVTAGLSGVGFAAALAVPGVIASAALAAPVWLASRYRTGRSERRANWDREVADYLHENDAPGIRQLLVDYAPGTEAAAGGGGVYYPRIARPFTGGREDQESATQAVTEGNAGARGKMYEAYFTQNLIVPPGTSEETKRLMILDTATYIHDITHNGYENVPLMHLRHADAFAQLQKMRRDLVAAGEPPLLSYFDESGQRQWINLDDLNASKRGEVIAAYMEHILPIQEIILFNALGDMAREHQNPAKRTEEFGKAETSVKRMILMKVIHHVHEMERIIRATDWPGVDLPVVSDGNTQSQNLMRSFLAAQMDEAMTTAVSKLLYGQLSPNDYKALLLTIDRSIAQLRDDVATDPFASVSRARAYLQEKNVDIAAAQNPAENPLYALLKK